MSAPGSQLQDKRDNTDVDIESAYLKELQGQKDELMTKVGALKTDLQEWRRKLDSQVTSYKTEVVKLRNELNSEVEALKSEFMELKLALRQQLEMTSSLVKDAQASALPPGIEQ